ncbi:DUF1989 domain-containing protein [Lysobacter sp. TAB13]|uniref:DUF1989 domain-containing protein n=1 Tax=Lysobacter sp. TAB13 TaxID=3233065 RepID=UPI003F9A4DAD
MPEQRQIPAASGIGLRLRQGQRLRIIDNEGGQTGDLMAFAPDGSERLSNGRTFDYGGKLFLSSGDVLWSDRSRPMLTILDDDAGRHDFLYSACSAEMYRIQYGASGEHPNCTDNLSAALRELGIEPAPLPTPFNLFMHVDVGTDGALSFPTPVARPGRSIVFRAEMDLAIAVSACPGATCNGGAPPRPLAFELIED